MSFSLTPLLRELDQIEVYEYTGKINAITGLTLEIKGIESYLSIGSRCEIKTSEGKTVLCEIVGFRPDVALALPFSSLEGVGLGNPVRLISKKPTIYPSNAWLGRVVDALGQPIDNKGSLLLGETAYSVYGSPLAAHKRVRVGERLELGIRAINTFTTVCRGQRMGIFAGSGVGKSMLLSMLTKNTKADVIVIGLVGERGKEVKDFLELTLSPEELSRTVIVVATSDESAMRRRAAAYLTLTLAEYYRDQGLEVLCLMDSVTRFAMAQREIGLSVGEPPASKGYTPTVFAELPRLLERAGPGNGQGNITGLFTVLVEGDDHNEPISDAVRAILDGHIVLERAIAERGRYPAINVLRSISRTMPDCNNDDENKLIKRARALIATYENMADMIRLGAYRAGTDPEVDEAIKYSKKLEAFLAQDKKEKTTFEAGFDTLRKILTDAA